MSLATLDKSGGIRSQQSNASDILFWLLTDHLVIFIAFWAVFSVWLGFLGIVAVVPFLAAIASTLFFFIRGKKLHEHANVVRTSSILLSCLAIFLGFFIIYLFFHGGYDLSADAAPSFAAELIHNAQRIPSTYAPHFDVPFFYHLGLVSMIGGLPLEWIPAHIWLIFFGLLSYCLIITYLTKIGHEIIKNDLAIWTIPAFLVAIRMLPTHLLTGEYPLLVSVAIGLASLTFFSRNVIIASILFAASIVLHPLGGIVTGLFWILSGYHFTIRHMIFAGIASLIAFLPVFVLQWLPYFTLPRSEFTIGRLPLFQDVLAMVQLTGWGLFVILGIGLFFYSRKQSPFSHPNVLNRLLLIILGGCMFYAIGQFFPDFVITHKSILLVGFGVVLLASHYWSAILNQKNAPYFFIFFLLGGLLFLSTSSYLKPYIQGSKAHFDEAQFATSISSIVQDKSTLFLSGGQGKMAQYAHTTPYDATSVHFVTSTLWKTLQTTGAKKMVSDSNQFRFMINTKCVTCIEELNPEFVIVNEKRFPKLSNENWTLLKEKAPFYLYQRKI